MHLWNKVAICAAGAVLLVAVAQQVSLSPRRAPIVNELRSACVADIAKIEEEIRSKSFSLSDVAATKEHIQRLMAEHGHLPNLRDELAPNLAKMLKSEVSIRDSLARMEARHEAMVRVGCEPPRGEVNAVLAPLRAEWVENAGYRIGFVLAVIMGCYVLGWAIIWLSRGAVRSSAS